MGWVGCVFELGVSFHERGSIGNDCAARREGSLRRSLLQILSWKQPKALIVAAALLILALFDGGSSTSACGVLGLISWGCVLVGFVWRSLPTGEVSRYGILALAALILISVLAGISSLWAVDQGRAVEEAATWLAFSGVFALVLFTGVEPGWRTIWIQGIGTGTGLVVILAVVSRVWPDPFPMPVSLPSPQALMLMGSSSRWSFPLGYWNALGLFAAVAVISLATLAIGATGLGAKAKGLATGTSAVAVGVLIMTGSRGAILACAIGLALLLLFSRDRRRVAAAVGTALLGGTILYLAIDLLGLVNVGPFGMRLERALLAVAVACVVTLSTAGWIALDALVPSGPMSRRHSRFLVALVALVAASLLVASHPTDRIHHLTEPPLKGGSGRAISGDMETGNGRWQLWGAALKAFRFRPLLGLGAGGFEEWWAATSPINLFARNAHSLPLGVLAELGVVGGCLLLILFASFSRAALVGYRRQVADPQIGWSVGVLATVLSGSLFDWTWTVPAAFVPGMVAGSILMGYRSSASSPPRAYRLGLVVMPTAWAAVAFSALAIAGDIRLAESRSAVADGDLPLAATRATDARALEPWSSSPYIQSSLVAERAGKYREALTFLTSAKARDERDWRISLLEAQVQSRLGNEAAAQAARERAYLLYPRLREVEKLVGA